MVWTPPRTAPRMKYVRTSATQPIDMHMKSDFKNAIKELMLAWAEYGYSMIYGNKYLFSEDFGFWNCTVGIMDLYIRGGTVWLCSSWVWWHA